MPRMKILDNLSLFSMCFLGIGPRCMHVHRDAQYRQVQPELGFADEVFGYPLPVSVSCIFHSCGK